MLGGFNGIGCRKLDFFTFCFTEFYSTIFYQVQRQLLDQLPQLFQFSGSLGGLQNFLRPGIQQKQIDLDCLARKRIISIKNLLHMSHAAHSQGMILIDQTTLAQLQFIHEFLHAIPLQENEGIHLTQIFGKQMGQSLAQPDLRFTLQCGEGHDRQRHRACLRLPRQRKTHQENQKNHPPCAESSNLHQGNLPGFGFQIFQ